MEPREQAQLSPTPSRWRHVLKSKQFIVLAVCLVLCIAAAVYISTDKAVAIMIDGQIQQVFTNETTVADILTENDIAICEGDLVKPELTAKVGKNDTIEITRAFDFSVYADGKKTVLHSTPVTVQEALKMAGVTLGELDQTSAPLDQLITSPQKVTVARVDVEYVTREVTVEAPVEVRRDSSLAAGASKVLAEGSVGLKKEVLAIYTKDGAELTRQVTETSMVKEAEVRVVAQGTMQVASRDGGTTASSTFSNATAKPASSGKASTATGKSSKSSTTSSSSKSKAVATSGQFAGKSYMTVKAYAYASDGHTAMGTDTHRGVIAVDPSVIPLGTKVYVEGYGYATAEDTGGDIKGKTIDCFMESESQCINWGVQHVKVYIL